jgi:transposase InsO family protein
MITFRSSSWLHRIPSGTYLKVNLTLALDRKLGSIQTLLEHQKHLVFIQGPYWLPGPLAAGNALADRLTQIQVASPLHQAQRLHNVFHQSSKNLQTLFPCLIHAQYKAIIRDCHKSAPLAHIGPLQGMGVNPRGVKANALWQMDVTHYSPFGKQKYLGVTIAKYSKYIMITPLPGEKTKHTIQHCLNCFLVMGVPHKIKTDNGPAYTSHQCKDFCAKYSFKHITGIPYNPQGQGIKERAHQELKGLLRKQREE